MNNILYLLSVVAVGWAVTFGLRALPFVLFSGKDRVLPKWVEKFGAIVSPVIIAGLIIYSYATLTIDGRPAWNTLWPYLAGVLTIALQLWKRNPLVSILAGTILYMVLISTCGCATVKDDFVLDMEHPLARATNHGLYVGERKVTALEAVEILEDNYVPKTRTVYIAFDPELTDLSEAKFLMACLAKAGWKRPILVTTRHGDSYTTGKKVSTRKKNKPNAAQPRQIR